MRSALSKRCGSSQGGGCCWGWGCWPRCGPGEEEEDEEDDDEEEGRTLGEAERLPLLPLPWIVDPLPPALPLPLALSVHASGSNECGANRWLWVCFVAPEPEEEEDEEDPRMGCKGDGTVAERGIVATAGTGEEFEFKVPAPPSSRIGEGEERSMLLVASDEDEEAKSWAAAGRASASRTTVRRPVVTGCC